MKFTERQKQIIDMRGGNILVSAAAGSGKTAVLVERILNRICDKKNPVDVDRLLVVTFTNAAAAGMRERIAGAIRERLCGNPQDQHLQRQEALLHHAQITTIDSFCLSVLRNHFQQIGLDPSFRVADEGELNLLKKEVAEALLEDRFASGNQAFFDFVECFAPKKTDTVIEDYMLDLYRFSMSYPWPEKWLRQCLSAYEAPQGAEIFDLPFMADVRGRIAGGVSEMLSAAGEAVSLCLEPDGPAAYLEPTVSYQEFLERLSRCGTFQEYRDALKGRSLRPLTGKRAPEASEENKGRVKALRDEIKAWLSKLEEQYFFTDQEQMLSDLRACLPSAGSLISLTLEFMERFREAKREKNLVDFGDLEHLALEILVEERDGELTATQAAREYRETFEEILIDEYQDSNLVQETLLSVISRQEDGEYNYTMVGDVKQSIYRFRLARPEIFMEKYSRYAQDGGPRRKVVLAQNFRSRPEVIDTVNFIMKQIMGKKLGNIAYDEEAALHPGADYPDPQASAGGPPGAPYRAELLLAVGKCPDQLSARETEARMIAGRILELVGKLDVTTREYKKDGEAALLEGRAFRKARYSDIVILLRSNQGWDDVFYRVLTEAGIPVHIASRTGYFSAPEVRAALDFLRILDNPLQDVPLAAVLKSVWGGFGDHELACISAGRQGLRLYERLKLCAAQAGTREGGEPCSGEGGGRCSGEAPEGAADAPGVSDAGTCKKARDFLALLERYRDALSYMTVYELLLKLYEEKGFYLNMSVMPAGRQRAANLDMLLKKARDFEKISYKGLFNFVRYMEGLKKYQVDYGEANVLGEQDDVVRIMSIHKSKGLEFPVCFVSGIQKKFNETDLRKSILMDADLGLGMDYVNPTRRTKAPTLLKKVMQHKGRLDGVAEELRLLYVAMTRAEEKLILTGWVEDAAAYADKTAVFQGTDRELLDTRVIEGAGSYLGLIFPALSRYPGFRSAMVSEGAGAGLTGCFVSALPPLDVKLSRVEDLVAGEAAQAAVRDVMQEDLERIGQEALSGKVFDEKEREKIQEKFSRPYAYELPSPLYTKISVTELKRMEHGGDQESYRLYEEPVAEPYLPRFVEERKEAAGAERGTAYHKVMELWDYGRAPGEAVEAIEDMVLSGRLTKEQADMVSPGDIGRFLKTSLAGRIGRAASEGRLYREQPFVLGLPASRLDPGFPQDEVVLVQGIIDLFFEEDGRLILVDYKTDRGKSADELTALYRVQLDYYAQALFQITGKEVGERIIYSFALGREIGCQ